MSRRRKPRGKAAKAAAAERKALRQAVINGALPATAGASLSARASQPLTDEQQHVLHSAIARAQACGKPVLPHCRKVWRDTYQAELERSVFTYYATSPKRAAVRSHYLAEALNDPEVLAATAVGYMAQAATRILEAALEPVPSGAKPVTFMDPNAGDAWRTRLSTVERRDLKAALGAIDRLMRLAELRRDLDGVHRVPLPSTSTRRPAGRRTDPDDDLPSIDPALEDELNAEAGQPFRMPDIQGTTLSREEHAERIRRWDEDGIPPPGAPPRPTRKIHADGTVEILAGDGAGTVLERSRPVAEEPELGEAVLSTQAAPRRS